MKPAPDSAPSASGTHPALSPSARFVYSFDSTSSAATSAVPAPTTVAAAVAEVASSSSSAASGSRPIAPLPSRPIPPPSTQATPSAPLPAPPNGASPYVEVLRRQLVAATAAKDAALAERDVALAENAVLLASAHAERASRQATLAATHATEARIAAAGEYIETSHRAFLKLFMEPRIQAEGEKVTLELMKSLWTAFAQSQHVVLEGKGEGRELEELLDEGAVLRAREILEEAMRGPQHLPGHEHTALYGAMQEGEQEDEEYEDDDSDAEVDQIDGDEEPVASSTSVPVHMTTILHGECRASYHIRLGSAR